MRVLWLGGMKSPVAQACKLEGSGLASFKNQCILSPQYSYPLKSWGLYSFWDKAEGPSRLHEGFLRVLSRE